MATLNVKDALSYLDQVKVQFAEHPDVYNRFLDIMKDFKSQSIDTPGVIERVSTLFRGHPSLIQGFNTFLPPGYRIECSLDPSESNLITVTTPTGTTTQTPGGVGIAGAISRMSGGMSPAGQGPGQGVGPSGSVQQGGGQRGPGMGMMQGGRHGEQQHQHQQHQQDGPGGLGGYMGSGSGHPMAHSQSAGGYPNASGQGMGPGQHMHGGPGGMNHGHGHHGHGHAHAHGHAPSLPVGSLTGLQHPAPHHAHRPHSPMALTPGSVPGAPATPGATAGAGVLSHGVVGAQGAHAAGGLSGGGADPKRPPVEFNHAINYVNKIKQRFSGDPDTYKQFLEILQTYQKEQRPIHDVYAQVTVLFEHAKDLLDEFKQFLPDTSNGAAPSGGLFGMLGQVTSGLQTPGLPAPTGTGGPGQGPGSHPAQRTGPDGQSGAGVEGPGGSQGSKKGAAGQSGGASGSRKKRSGAPGESGKAAGNKPKKSKHHHKGEPRSPPPRADGGASPPYGHAGHPPHAHGALAYAADGTLVAADPAIPSGMAQSAMIANGLAIGPSQAPLASLDEVAFFDRVKKHIDDRATYLEFLKLLNLYTQDIIDVRTLVDRATLFIGSHRELFATFKGLCGYEMGRHGWLENEDPIVENVPALQRERVDLSTCKVYGASYRKLPKSEINLACSGRDPMCWEVLNDMWVSHPTWASEGESFNPHKKNVYEDALYRSEEERHEYDYHIEANLRTIALLEPIAARISTMDAEERAAFRLKPGLGGQSKSIYQRVIKKVYGREHGLEVIAALHDNPCVAVPVVLARLKQKDEEWKRAQREWNKVWREVDARNYYKSLDHQGVNFKASDKKALTTKALVAEIEARRTQQQQRRLTIDPSLPRPKPRHQFAYPLDDMQVLTDVLKLVFSFLDRAAGGYSTSDRERIEAFLRSFIPQLLDLDETEFEELLNGDVDLDDADDDADSRVEDDTHSEGTVPEDTDAETSTSGSPGPANKRGKKQGQTADLRRRILRTQAETSGSAPSKAANVAQGEGDAALSTAKEVARASSPAIMAEVASATEALANEASPASSLKPVDAGAADTEMQDAASAPESVKAEEGATTPAGGAITPPSTTSASKPADLNDTDDSSGSATAEVTEAAKAAAEAEAQEAEGTWISTDMSTAFDSRSGYRPGASNDETGGASVANGERKIVNPRRKCNFFCNTTFYVFTRLLQLIYSRLHKMKTLAAEMASAQPPRRRVNPVAVELGLQDGSSGPAAVVAAAAAGAGVTASEESGIDLPPSRYYDTLLDLCEKLFDGDVDQATFEESLRYMYGINGYVAFTLDKVIGALVKTVQTITTDTKCQELQAIMERDRARPHTERSGYKQQIASRMAAETVIGKDENMFRIEWVAPSATLLVQMLSRDDLTLDDARSLEQRWLYYISSYCLWMPTEGLTAEAQAPFLKRNLPINPEAETDPVGTDYKTRSALEIKICIRTYRLFFVQDTEDVFARLRPAEELATLEQRGRRAKKRRAAAWNRWLDKKRKEIDDTSLAPAAVDEQQQQQQRKEEENALVSAPADANAAGPVVGSA